VWDGLVLGWDMVRISQRIDLPNNEPKQHLSAIKPISGSGTRIVSIMHQHNVETDNGSLIRGAITLFPQIHFDQMKTVLTKDDTKIIHAGTKHLTHTRMFILIGKILHFDLSTTCSEKTLWWNQNL
jgi:ACT domain-containing protein